MATIKRDVVIDPRFAPPTGVIGVRQETEDDGVYAFEESGDVFYDDEPYEPVAPVVNSITIVAQTIRQSPDGRTVVDVVIDIADVDPTAYIELDLTKIVS